MYTTHMHISSLGFFTKCIRGLELILAMGVMLAVIASAAASTPYFIAMDWSDKETFYAVIYLVLLLVIGLELVHMLVAHNLSSVLELLAFVIARKMLKPDLTSIDVILGVVGFVLLLGARYYFMDHKKS